MFFIALIFDQSLVENLLHAEVNVDEFLGLYLPTLTPVEVAEVFIVHHDHQTCGGTPR
jgi:hypothetical protein